MTDDRGAALQVALAYHRAWTRGSFDDAMGYIADDIECLAPAGRLEGAGAFRGFMEPFAGMVIESRLLAAFGDEETAVVMYEAGTAAVREAPGAECLTVRNGRIVQLRIVFDRAPFDAARRAAAAG